MKTIVLDLSGVGSTGPFLRTRHLWLPDILLLFYGTCTLLAAESPTAAKTEHISKSQAVQLSRMSEQVSVDFAEYYVRALNDPDFEWKVRREALLMLALLKDEKAVSPLIDSLRPNKDHVPLLQSRVWALDLIDLRWRDRSGAKELCGSLIAKLLTGPMSQTALEQEAITQPLEAIRPNWRSDQRVRMAAARLLRLLSDVPTNTPSNLSAALSSSETPASQHRELFFMLKGTPVRHHGEKRIIERNISVYLDPNGSIKYKGKRYTEAPSGPSLDFSPFSGTRAADVIFLEF